MSFAEVASLFAKATTRTISVTCLAALALVTLAEFGMFPRVFSGFATADSLTLLGNQSKQHWADEVEDAAMDMHERQCSTTNKDLRALYAKIVQRREQEYQDLKGKPLQTLPPCGDL